MMISDAQLLYLVQLGDQYNASSNRSSSNEKERLQKKERAMLCYDTALKLAWKQWQKEFGKYCQLSSEIEVSSDKEDISDILKYLEEMNLSERTNLKLPLHFANILNNKALLYLQLLRYQDSCQNFNAALQIKRQHLPMYHPDICGSLHNLGLALQCNQDYLKSYDIYSECVGLKQSNWVDCAPHMAGTVVNLGMVCFMLDRRNEAIRLLKEGIHTATRFYKDDKHFSDINGKELIRGLHYLGNIYHEGAEYSLALQCYAQVLHLSKKGILDETNRNIFCAKSLIQIIQNCISDIELKLNTSDSDGSDSEGYEEKYDSDGSQISYDDYIDSGNSASERTLMNDSNSNNTTENSVSHYLDRIENVCAKMKEKNRTFPDGIIDGSLTQNDNSKYDTKEYERSEVNYKINYEELISNIPEVVKTSETECDENYSPKIDKVKQLVEFDDKEPFIVYLSVMQKSIFNLLCTGKLYIHLFHGLKANKPPLMLEYPQLYETSKPLISTRRGFVTIKTLSMIMPIKEHEHYVFSNLCLPENGFIIEALEVKLTSHDHLHSLLRFFFQCHDPTIPMGKNEKSMSSSDSVKSIRSFIMFQAPIDDSIIKITESWIEHVQVLVESKHLETIYQGNSLYCSLGIVHRFNEAHFSLSFDGKEESRCVIFLSYHLFQITTYYSNTNYFEDY